MKYYTQILQQLFPSVLFSTDKKEIYLTFDDGPRPIATPSVLNILRKRNIRATFFLVGQNVREYPDFARQIKSEGHQIGNHSYSHANLLFKKKSFVTKEIIQTKEILEATVGEHSPFFRPPYGYFSFSTLNVIKETGLTCVLWSIDSKDFRAGASAKIERRITEHTANGDILLFHDNEITAQTLHTYLPNLLDTLLGEGFIFNTLPL